MSDKITEDLIELEEDDVLSGVAEELAKGADPVALVELPVLTL